MKRAFFMSGFPVFLFEIQFVFENHNEKSWIS